MKFVGIRQITWFFLSLFLFCTPILALDFDHQHSKWTEWLQKYARTGLVDYELAKTNQTLLAEYLAQLSEPDVENFNKWTPSQQKAYWINLYNAATVKLILDHYPVKSIKKIGIPLYGPWKKSVGKYVGSHRSLNEIEHRILRKKFSDCHVHAALVCASMSCPKLQEKAFIATSLDQDLDRALKEFINDESRNKIDFEGKTLVVSEIFKWYEKDFNRKYGSILNLFQKTIFSYSFKNAKTTKWKIAYMPYDWSLNGK